MHKALGTEMKYRVRHVLYRYFLHLVISLTKCIVIVSGGKSGGVCASVCVCVCVCVCVQSRLGKTTGRISTKFSKNSLTQVRTCSQEFEAISSNDDVMAAILENKRQHVSSVYRWSDIQLA